MLGTILISGKQGKALRAPEGENLNFHVSDKVRELLSHADIADNCMAQLQLLSIDTTAKQITRMDVSAQSTQLDAEKVVFNERVSGLASNAF